MINLLLDTKDARRVISIFKMRQKVNVLCGSTYRLTKYLIIYYQLQIDTLN